MAAIPGYFRIGGHSPGTRTVGVSLFGLVNERIGDIVLTEMARLHLQMAFGGRT
jgi:hypothetical protein